MTVNTPCDPAVEYPYFWGYADERGKGQAHGTNLNEPLPKGAAFPEYLAAVERIKDALRAFGPAWLILGAGFDTHATDPIGGFGLQTQDYEVLGQSFAELRLPTLICQEGGYNVDVLGDCVCTFLRGFGSAE